MACLASDHGSLGVLWAILASWFLLVLIASGFVVLGPESPATTLAKRFALRFGRAAQVGGAVLALFVLSVSGLTPAELSWLVVGASALIVCVLFDWVGILRPIVTKQQAAYALDVVGPRLLLVSVTGSGFVEGESVEVSVSEERRVPGVIVSRLPHPGGSRYSVALKHDSEMLSAHFPVPVNVAKGEELTDFAGAAGATSGPQTLEFQPARDLEIGDPLTTGSGEGTLVYQVADLRLVRSQWDGAEAIVRHASAQLIGRVTGSFVRAASRLPDPHEPISAGCGLSGGLEDEYYRVGNVKGTEIDVGFITDETRQGHLAVLGMSGMGKTGVAHRVCKTLGTDHVVIALDTTGEYLRKLGFPAWTPNDFSTLGHFVYEPAGDPPTKAAEFIRDCMQVAAAEYLAGGTPIRRVILLEEAHTFLPEWNVALRHQQEQVANSTRMIMQARKFGITFVIVSQRTAVVSKSAISQCENYVILKTLDHTGLEYLESLVGPKMRDAIPGLERFEGMCVGPAFNTDMPVIATLEAP